MTRINVVPVEILTDDHLLAEYSEITRPFNKMAKRIENENLSWDAPKQYVLGKGHETFFFDKLFYLWKRYGELFIELVSRGVNVDIDKYEEISESLYKQFVDTDYWNDYIPIPEEMYVNMARLAHSHFKDSIGDYKQ